MCSLRPCLLQGDSPFFVLLSQEHRWINGEDAFADHPLGSDKGAPWLLLHKRNVLFPSLGKTPWQLEFDEWSRFTSLSASAVHQH